MVVRCLVLSPRQRSRPASSSRETEAPAAQRETVGQTRTIPLQLRAGKLVVARIVTNDSACEALSKVGFPCTPAQVRVEARDERWLVHLPRQHLAWFASSDAGLARLQSERRLLRLLEERCSFGAPRVIFESIAGDFDVRTMVPGMADPWKVYPEVRANRSLARQVGTAVGAILAQQHTHIRVADVAGSLPPRPSWPESAAWVCEHLPKVVDDSELLANAGAIMRAYENVAVAHRDRALVHADLGLHNLAIDAASYAVNGVFDYDDSAWADRHHDFRYLVLDSEGEDLLEAAVSVYEPAVGYNIQRERVLLYNAACAVTFLAFRAGKRPEERSCGRTLEQDLRWSRFAIARALY